MSFFSKLLAYSYNDEDIISILLFIFSYFLFFFFNGDLIIDKDYFLILLLFYLFNSEFGNIYSISLKDDYKIFAEFCYNGGVV